MICGVIIGGKDTLTEWGLMLCNDLAIGAAVPRYRFVTIPEMSGALDLTESLTGAVPFDQRTITFTLFAVHDVIAGTRHPATEEHFRTILSQFSAFANGKKLHIYLPDCPDHYFIGRVSVGGKSGFNSGKVRVEIIADPYRMKDNETVLSVDDGNFFKSAPIENGIAYFDDGLNKPMPKAEVTISPKQDGTPWISTTPDTDPYLYRALPSNVGNSELDTLVGGTVNFNQVIETAYKSGSITFTESMSYYDIGFHSGLNMPVTAGHRMFVGAKISRTMSGGNNHLRIVFWQGNNATGLRVEADNGAANGYFCTIATVNSGITKITKISGNNYRGKVGFDVDDVISYDDLVLVDLTAMFNPTIADYIYTLESGTAGAGVAWLKKYGFMTKDYYAYDAGSLLSVKTSAKVITGKNILGDVAFANSIKAALSSSTLDTTAKTITFNGSTNGTYDIRLESLPFKENTRYTLIYSYTGNNRNIRWEYTDGTYDPSSNVTNGAYVSAQGKTVKGLYKVNNSTADVVLSYESCGIFEGVLTASDFEAYNPTTYALDSDLELRGPLALDANNNLVYDGDVYPPSGNVTRRFALVDMGTLTYNLVLSQYFQTNELNSVIKKPSSNTDVANIFSGVYTPVAWNATPGDKCIAVAASGLISCTNSAYNDADTFKTAMSGVYLLYELATPTTESADPYTSPQSVSDGGTEEYVDSRTVPMPVGHRTFYANIVPITGETGTNLTHTGVNLLGGTDLKDAVVAYIPTASVDTTNKYVSFASGSATVGGGLTKGVPFKENTRYTFILTLYKSSGTGSNLRLYYTDNSYDDISVSAAQTRETVVFVSDANKTVDSLRKRNSSGTTRIYYEESGIFEGVLTASQFTEYQGETYNVTFTDQGTVYGGTYDFVSGTLRVTYANIASYNGETIGTPWLSSYEEYSVGATPTTGAQVVYPLSSPQTYTLTPQAISSVLGINYAWSTEGEITLIEYQYNDTVVINNEGMPAIPTINASLAGPTVTLGAVSHTLVSGDNRFTDFILQAGDNYVVVDNPAGTITFTYQEGAL